MGTIKTVMFDLGGVIITLNQPGAVERFTELGLANAKEMLDPYRQHGIFGDVEQGTISAETFRSELSKLVGRELTFEECRYGWLGYVKELPKRNLEVLRELRRQGYRLILLSNTNPFMMSWVMSPDFDGEGHSLADYMDACYLSYEMKCMKPDDNMFRSVLMKEKTFPHEILFLDDGPHNVAVASQIGFRTYCPENGADWTKEIFERLKY
ncbi:MAG: HAD family phosphatase [Prevotella sp.]|nr:HAD family phosphatase [Prevotella sp.]